MTEHKNKGGGSHKDPPHLSDPAKIKPVKPAKPAAKPAKTKVPLKRTTPRVKKSPVKDVVTVNEEEEIDEGVLYEKHCDHSEEEREDCSCAVFVCVDCLCGDWSVQDRNSIQCPACFHWYHHDCVGLDGLSKDDVDKLTNWACYSCWSKTSPIAPSTVAEDIPEVEAMVPDLDNREKGESTLDDIMDEMAVLKGQLNELKLMSGGKGPAVNGSSGGLNCTTIKLMMKEELNLQVPVIAVRVKDVVEGGVKKILDANTEQKKSWAEMVKGYDEKLSKATVMNRDMLEGVVSSSNQKQAEITESNINHEQYERLRRKMNVVIRKVPESNSEVIEDRIEHDREWLLENTDIKDSEIVRCMRPGQRRDGKPRPLICQLKDEDLVQKYTDYGKGSKIGKGLPRDSPFINLDLSPADQESDFRARKLRKDSRSRQQSES